MNKAFKLVEASFTAIKKHNKAIYRHNDIFLITNGPEALKSEDAGYFLEQEDLKMLESFKWLHSREYKTIDLIQTFCFLIQPLTYFSLLISK